MLGETYHVFFLSLVELRTGGAIDSRISIKLKLSFVNDFAICVRYERVIGRAWLRVEVVHRENLGRRSFARRQKTNNKYMAQCIYEGLNSFPCFQG
jgi:hypothetical protein